MRRASWSSMQLLLLLRWHWRTRRAACAAQMCTAEVLPDMRADARGLIFSGRARALSRPHVQFPITLGTASRMRTVKRIGCVLCVCYFSTFFSFFSRLSAIRVVKCCPKLWNCAAVSQPQWAQPGGAHRYCRRLRGTMRSPRSGTAATGLCNGGVGGRLFGQH